MRATRLLVTLLLVSMTACGVGQKVRLSRPDVAAEARAVLDEFARAYNAHEAAAITGLYDEAAAVVWPLDRGVATTPRDVRDLVTRAVKESRSSSATIKSVRVRRVGDHHAASVSTWEFSGPKGRKSKVVATDILVERDGHWRYLLNNVEALASSSKSQRAPMRVSHSQCFLLRNWCEEQCRDALSVDIGSRPDCEGGCLVGEIHCNTYGSGLFFWINFN